MNITQSIKVFSVLVAIRFALRKKKNGFAAEQVKKVP